MVAVAKCSGLLVHRGWARDRDVLMTRVRDFLGQFTDEVLFAALPSDLGPLPAVSGGPLGLGLVVGLNDPAVVANALAQLPGFLGPDGDVLAQTADGRWVLDLGDGEVFTYGVVDDGAVIQPLLAPEGVFPQFGGLEVNTSSTALQALTDAVLYIHEYPYESADGLASRILAVAEQYDAMTRSRVRRAMEPNEAMHVLQSGKGTAYDADCVDALTNVLRPARATLPVSGLLGN